MTNDFVCPMDDKRDKYQKITDAHVTRPPAWPTSLNYNVLSEFTV